MVLKLVEESSLAPCYGFRKKSLYFKFYMRKAVVLIAEKSLSDCVCVCV